MVLLLICHSAFFVLLVLHMLPVTRKILRLLNMFCFLTLAKGSFTTFGFEACGNLQPFFQLKMIYLLTEDTA
jgi:hypothetical protein